MPRKRPENALVLPPQPILLSTLPRHEQMQRVLDRMMKQKSAQTINAYRDDLQRFAQWLQMPDSVSAAAHVFGLNAGDANALVGDYLDSLKVGAPAANRNLSAIKTMFKTGRMLGLVAYTIEVPETKVKRKPRPGPEFEEVTKMLAVAKIAAETPGPKQNAAIRGYAILRLLTDLGVRQGSVRLLLAENIVIAEKESYLDTTLKGDKPEDDLERFHLFGPTKDALQAWLDIRGKAPGPCFYGFHPAVKKMPVPPALTGKSIRAIIKQLAQTYPHAFRHTAITKILKETGSLHKAMVFARHKDPRTTAGYFDQTADVAREATEILLTEHAKGARKEAVGEAFPFVPVQVTEKDKS